MQKDFMVADIHMLKPCGCAFLNTTTLTQCNCHHAASGKAAQRTQGRKRTSLTMKSHKLKSHLLTVAVTGVKVAKRMQLALMVMMMTMMM